MTKFKNLKVGDKLSETQYYTVAKISGDRTQLVNDNGDNIVVDQKYVENCVDSASQFEETVKLSRTELANKFLNNTNTVMTVNFNLKVKKEDVMLAVLKAIENKKNLEKEIKKAIDLGLEGEERIMVGRHYGSVNEFGRVSFIDMDEKKDISKAYDTRTRQVDPRTINWLICKNVKYVVK